MGDEKDETEPDMSWNDTMDYLMKWVAVELKDGRVIVGKLIDVSEHEDPILLIDGGMGFEIELSRVKSIEIR